MNITLYKAQSLIEGVEVEDLHLEATEVAPDLCAMNDWEREWSTFYQVQAESIVDALRRSLPGGTLDRILVLMLVRAQSIFAVPTWADPVEKPKEALEISATMSEDIQLIREILTKIGEACDAAEIERADSAGKQVTVEDRVHRLSMRYRAKTMG